MTQLQEQKRVQLAQTPDYLHRLRWHLQRADEWVKIADAKATIIIGINGAIMVAIMALNRSNVKSFMTSEWYLMMLSLMFAVALLASVSYAARAVLPDLRKKATEPSIFNPAVVAKMGLDAFRDSYQDLSPADELKNLENQVQTVSSIATRKFERIQKSVIGLICAVFFGATLIVANIIASI